MYLHQSFFACLRRLHDHLFWQLLLLLPPLVYLHIPRPILELLIILLGHLPPKLHGFLVRLPTHRASHLLRRAKVLLRRPWYCSCSPPPHCTNLLTNTLISHVLDYFVVSILSICIPVFKDALTCTMYSSYMCNIPITIPLPTLPFLSLCSSISNPILHANHMLHIGYCIGRSSTYPSPLPACNHCAQTCSLLFFFPLTSC